MAAEVGEAPAWLHLPGEMTVLPVQVKCSGPIRKEMVLCRYLQSWLTVAMKCLVMYSYSRQASPPAKGAAAQCRALAPSSPSTRAPAAAGCGRQGWPALSPPRGRGHTRRTASISRPRWLFQALLLDGTALQGPTYPISDLPPSLQTGAAHRGSCLPLLPSPSTQATSRASRVGSKDTPWLSLSPCPGLIPLHLWSPAWPAPAPARTSHTCRHHFTPVPSMATEHNLQVAPSLQPGPVGAHTADGA